MYLIWSIVLLVLNIIYSNLNLTYSNVFNIINVVLILVNFFFIVAFLIRKPKYINNINDENDIMNDDYFILTIFK